MKNILIKFLILLTPFVGSSCVDDLLNQKPRNEMADSEYWKTIDDANYALFGVYQGARTFFQKNYTWDGASEMMHSRVAVPYNGNWSPTSSIGNNNKDHFTNGYMVIDRANAVLQKLHTSYSVYTNPSDIAQLKRIEGELLFLRSIVYFRLMDLWGDIPYYTYVLDGNKEAYTLTRTPIETVKDKILEDLTNAIPYVPATVGDGERGRATRASIYAFRGKVKLYWACWAKNGDIKTHKIPGIASQATEYYKSAAEDFKEVMKPEYKRALYRNGEPGTADKPLYADLFDGLHEYSEEVIFATSNAGPGFGVSLGDTYIYDFGTRSTGAGGCNVTPTIRLANRYQLISTGDFAPELVPSSSKTLANGACNRASYEGRDYRMQATIMWDGERMMRISDDGMVIGPDTMTFEYKKGDNVNFINAQGCQTGYIYRKFIRQYPFGPREEGQQDIYLMRLPDLWLMYCEAVNEYNNGPTSELFDLVNKIRHRGGLPNLNSALFNTKDTFFKAIEQERIVELTAEGHRYFDIRRWNMVRSIWTQPNGLRLVSTWGETDFYRDEFRNAQEKDFQKFDLYQIPPAEIIQNPAMTQNDPWL